MGVTLLSSLFSGIQSLPEIRRFATVRLCELWAGVALRQFPQLPEVA
jgi:hypothetical protein